MYTVDGKIQLNANDLVNHLACRHLTELNLGGRGRPPGQAERLGS